MSSHIYHMTSVQSSAWHTCRSTGRGARGSDEEGGGDTDMVVPCRLAPASARWSQTAAAGAPSITSMSMAVVSPAAIRCCRSLLAAASCGRNDCSLPRTAGAQWSGGRARFWTLACSHRGRVCARRRSRHWRMRRRHRSSRIARSLFLTGPICGGAGGGFWCRRRQLAARIVQAVRQ